MASVIVQQLPLLPSLDATKQATTVSARSNLLTLLPLLRSQLSAKSPIYLPKDDEFGNCVQRFSDYKQPTPGAVVCPTTEQDIISTVQWATANGIRFLASAGRHGWAFTLSAVGPNDILINLRNMKEVKIDVNHGIATLQAGTLTGEVLKAAQAAGVHVVTAASDSVGAVPSILGGGLGNLVANYGLASDNIISARVVTASGKVVIASATENADLFWALRGAGHNFGIVTELKVKAHPQINHGKHWSGMLGFPGSIDIAERIVETIEDMAITNGKAAEGISCTLFYARSSPAFQPTVLLKLSFNGTAEAAKEAFAPLYEITQTLKPSINTSEMLPADRINEIKDSVYLEGGSLQHAKRPVHSTSLANVDPLIMGQLYKRWEEFTAENEDAKESIVRVNFYDYRKVREVSVEDSAFAWRENPINVLQHWAFTDESLEEQVHALGREFRSALNNGSEPNVLMSFASGDEPASSVYGHALDRLRLTKSKWDPKGAFSFNNAC